MKTLILNCLSTNRNNNENKILDILYNELQSLGCELEIYNIPDLDINPCNACTNDYLFEYSTECRCNDDMNMLYPIFRSNKNWIFIADSSIKESVYYLKNLLDRMEPLFQPLYFYSNGLSNNLPPNLISEGNILFVDFANFENKLRAAIIKHISSYSLLFNRVFLGHLEINQNINDNQTIIKENLRNLIQKKEIIE
jgi:hypothetical protein